MEDFDTFLPGLKIGVGFVRKPRTNLGHIGVKQLITGKNKPVSMVSVHLKRVRYC
jgi:hypothetical protein